MVPSETPDYVILRLNRSLNAVLATSHVRKRLMKLGYVVPSSKESPEGLEKRIGKDTEKWSGMLRLRETGGVH